MYHSDFWEKKLKAPPSIMDIIKHGYSIPFKSKPLPFFAHNNKSSLKNKSFVTESIEKLLINKCIKEVTTVPYCVNPLTVADHNSKLRLVLDLRHVNKHVQVVKFRYEDLKVVSDLFEENDHIFTFDLKSGYHHVPIHEEFTTYLGFSWEYQGVIKYFVFLVLPFGLNSACYIFTKLMRQLVKKWRSQGIKCVMYLDDGIGGDKSGKATKIRDIVISDVNSSGLTINLEKSSLTPETRKQWLGLIIDTKLTMFFVPQIKIEKLIDAIDVILKFETVTARSIAKIAGNIASMSLAVGPLSNLFTRQLYKFIESRSSWDKLRPLPLEVKNELLFWYCNIDKNNGLKFKNQPEITKICYSDASDFAYGGYIVQKLGNVIAKGNFSVDQKEESSTYRELLAVKNVLLSVAHLLKNETVQWFSDNMNATRIINKGSTKEHLQELAIEVYNLCLKNNIKLYPSWIPRENNKLADRISKEFDTDNWSIDEETFNYIESNYGSFTIDRFADNENRKCQKFNSKEFCPETKAVNAFTEHWGFEFNWLSPPIYLIGKTLQHLRNCKGKGVLFVPMWRSSYFWPLITRDGLQFETFIKHFLILDPFFYNRTTKSSVFDGFAKFYSLALYIDFSK